jgi:hypothetical protein
MPQFHVLACLNSQCGNAFGENLRNKLADAACDLNAILVELSLPQHAGEDGATEGLLRRDGCCRRALVSAQTRTLIVLQNVQAHGAPPFMRLQE